METGRYKRRRKTKPDIEGETSTGVVRSHSCSSHKNLLCPALWSTLPDEMLRLIYARLSVSGIRGVKSLSKKWNTVVTTDSDFHRLCDAVHGSLFALFDMSVRPGSFCVKVFNVKFNKWDTFEMVIKPPAYARTRWGMPYTSLICGDEGLLCFVSSLFFRSKYKETRPTVFIHVVNPLTGTSHELPPLLELCNIRMVQLIKSSETRGFKVFVLGDYTETPRPNSNEVVGGTAEVYDSTKGSWEPAEGSLGFVFGKYLNLTGNYRRSEVASMGSRSSCVYDCANGRLLYLEDYRTNVVDQSASIVSDARYKDHCFVLLKGENGPPNESFATETPTYYIEEYVIQMPTNTWVHVGRHRCAPFENPPNSKSYTVRLLACKGYLLAFGFTPRKGKRASREGADVKLGWLYDLSSGKWQDLELPMLPLPKRRAYYVQNFTPTADRYLYDDESFIMMDAMCSLKWSA